MRFVLSSLGVVVRKPFQCLLHCWVVLLPVLGGMTLLACDDSDRFTVNRGAVLRFSSDTIRFDTVLTTIPSSTRMLTVTTIPSSTRMLTVYNRNKNGLRIQRVWMERMKDSPYQVNVDGISLSPAQEAYDFEVRGGDSLMVFVKVLLPETGQDEPLVNNDRLMIQLESGVVQSVVLTATAQDSYMWRGKIIHSDTTLCSGRPFVIYDSLVVAPDITLTLERGVQLYFHDKANLLVYGRLDVRGVRDSMVVFRGDRTDRLFDYLPYDNTPVVPISIVLHLALPATVHRLMKKNSALRILCCTTSVVMVFPYWVIGYGLLILKSVTHWVIAFPLWEEMLSSCTVRWLSFILGRLCVARLFIWLISVSICLIRCIRHIS